jgi:hypothetical protein
MIINNTFFKKGINSIPDKDVTTRNPNVIQTESTLDDVISYHERIIITNALTPSLWATIVENYTNGVLDAGAPVWLSRLVNGYIYTHDEKEREWKGLADAQGLIVKYIFCQYLSDDLYSYLIRGVSKLKTDASELVNVTPLYVDQWNLFIEQYQGDYIFCGGEYYPMEFTNRFGGRMIDYQTSTNTGAYVDLLTYIEHYEKANVGTYTNINKLIYQDENKMGI